VYVPASLCDNVGSSSAKYREEVKRCFSAIGVGKSTTI
jgi:hypothetical protein